MTAFGREILKSIAQRTSAPELLSFMNGEENVVPY